MSAVVAACASDRELGTSPSRVVALVGAESGRYPYGNSLLVAGTEESLLIDPSLAVFERGGAPGRVDRLLISHGHEDHLAGVGRFPDAPVHAHRDDVQAVRALDGLLDVYGMSEPQRSSFGLEIERDFHYAPRPDAVTFEHAQCFGLGGGLTVEVVHLPGHTRGHCGFLIEPDGVFFVADIDLSAFGPYYGDHWSDLEDFERSLRHVRTIEARHYVTFHHKGIVSDRERFLEQLTAFEAVIADRERRLLAFLAEPRTIDDIVSHRFVYRPNVELVFADNVERRTAEQHLDRLARQGAVVLEDRQYRAV